MNVLILRAGRAGRDDNSTARVVKARELSLHNEISHFESGCLI